MRKFAHLAVRIMMTPKTLLYILDALLYIASLKNQGRAIYWKNHAPPIPQNIIKKLIWKIENCFAWIVAGTVKNIQKESNGRIKPNYYLIAAVLLSFILCIIEIEKG